MQDTTETKVVFKVDGMSCGHCVGRVEKALAATAGVVEAKVDLDSGTAEVRFGAETDADRIAAAITDAGYPAQAA